MKSKQWTKDREELRKIARKGLEGGEATFVYTLISHMRGKLHMRYYGKYSAGWRPYAETVPKDKRVAILSTEFRKAYGSYARTYYYMLAINDLSDQAEWLFAHEEYIKILAINPIFKRILIEGYPEVEETTIPGGDKLLYPINLRLSVAEEPEGV